MNKQQEKQARLARRHRRVRGKISGTAARPRLCVTRSNSNMYVQVIDDVAHTTICGVSTLGEAFKATGKSGATVEGAAELGTIVGKLAQENGVTEVVFDRGGHLYHGRVKAWRAAYVHHIRPFFPYHLFHTPVHGRYAVFPCKIPCPLRWGCHCRHPWFNPINLFICLHVEGGGKPASHKADLNPVHWPSSS